MRDRSLESDYTNEISTALISYQIYKWVRGNDSVSACAQVKNRNIHRKCIQWTCVCVIEISKKKIKKLWRRRQWTKREIKFGESFIHFRQCKNKKGRSIVTKTLVWEKKWQSSAHHSHIHCVVFIKIKRWSHLVVQILHHKFYSFKISQLVTLY